MPKKNTEAKISEDVLRFFCVANSESIVGCGWYDTTHCLKTCKFYQNKKQEVQHAIEKTKYWTR